MYCLLIFAKRDLTARILFLSSDLCTIQMFEINHSTFCGKWVLGTNDVHVQVKDKIGSGGFRRCHLADVKDMPPEYDFCHLPIGWVAKFYKENHGLEKTWSLCKKVSMRTNLECHVCC